MDFELRKAETLASLMAPWPDRSPKGNVDAPIAPLLELINLHSSFFTTSSCSGRISILRQPTESPNPNEGKITKKSKKKAGGGGWVFVSHDPVDPETIIDILFKSPAVPNAVDMKGSKGDTMVFRFEPLIVAVESKDALAAQELVAAAIACGFRESGITGMNRRIMVAIRCSIRLEVPLGWVSLIMVSPDYIRYLIGIANEKLMINRRRMHGLLNVLHDKVLPSLANQIIRSDNDSQACIAGKINSPDSEVKQKNMTLKNSQIEQEKMLLYDQDIILFPEEDKEISGMQKLSLSIASLTLVGEPIEKLFLWGHSATPLISEGNKLLIFGGFGGVGHHARRNNSLLLDIISGELRQIDVVGSPSPRVGHSSTILDNLLYVIGGRDGPKQIFNEVWTLNITEKRWTLLNCAGHAFYPRHRHATAAIGSKIYVFGGLNIETVYSCMNVLNSETLKWNKVSMLGEVPCARHSHSLVAYGPLLLMFGGYDGQKALGDFYIFDTRTSFWKKMKMSGRPPSPRFSHSMFIYKNFVGIIGGCPPAQHNENLALLNLCNNRWINVPIDCVGKNLWIRSSCSVIGDELLVVGGGASCYAFGTKFSYPMKLSLEFIDDASCHEVRPNSVCYYAIEGHEISQHGEILPDSSLASVLYLEVDTSSNRHAYESDVKHLALQIKKKHAKVGKDVLKKFGWLDRTRNVYRNLDGLHICLPITGEFYDLYQNKSFNSRDEANNLNEENWLSEEFVVNKFSIPMALNILSYFNASIISDDVKYDKKILSTPQNVMREMVGSLLKKKQFPLELIEQLPVRWERLGDIVVLPVSSFRDPRWHSIADELWPIVAKSLKALRLARQGRVSSNGTRDSTLEILVGDNGWVTHQENGILYSFDATKCMFSYGNLSEKLRMGRLDCRDEVIVDLFAGIGYFVLPLLAKAKGKLLYACEWNVHAIKALRHNVHANSVADRCIILEGDNRVTAPKGVADRVILGLLPSSECSWRTAVMALRTQGGLLHIHGNATDSEEKYWPEYVVDSIRSIAESEGLHWDVSVQHVQRVKSYGPHIHHLVADIKCEALVL